MSNELNIWILQTGEPLHIDEGSPRPMRAMNLSNAIIQKGHKVILWSTAFYHQEKRQRTVNFQIHKISDLLEINLVPSPGYMKNIGPGRLWDHFILAKNLIKEVKNCKIKPDLVFIGYPPIETAYILSKWLRKEGIPYLVDVKDQWPSIFIEALPNFAKSIGRLVFSPYFYMAKYCLKNATGIVGMSNGFINWTLDFIGREKNNFDAILPLTAPTPKLTTDEIENAKLWWDNLGVFEDDTLRICFVGSHSQAFDFDPVFNAVEELYKKNIQFQLVICGDGPFSNIWKERMANFKNVVFPGWINNAQIEVLCKRSFAALAPYKNVDNFKLNMPNKILDYLSHGLPILSPLTGEVSELISKYNVGISYGIEFGVLLEDCIVNDLSNAMNREIKSKNAYTVFNNNFDYNIVYSKFVCHLETIKASK